MGGSNIREKEKVMKMKLYVRMSRRVRKEKT